jgi:predicted Zn-dependent peptidase
VVPGNMVLAIVGDIDLAQTVATVEKTFNTFLARPVSNPRSAAKGFL